MRITPYSIVKQQRDRVKALRFEARSLRPHSHLYKRLEEDLGPFFHSGYIGGWDLSLLQHHTRGARKVCIRQSISVSVPVAASMANVRTPPGDVTVYSIVVPFQPESSTFVPFDAQVYAET